MTSRRILLLAIVVGSGCTADVPTLYATTTAMVSVELVPPDDGVPMAFGHYRWELVDAPEGGSAPPPTAETATIKFTPTRRGIYVFDRWFVGQAAEQISTHVVVTVNGAAPIATVVGPASVAVGEAATLDGRMSSSTELRALGFQWRLAMRPQSSMTTLADAQGTILMVVPDVAGEYLVELRVFDGELWSQPAKLTIEAR